MVNERMVWSFGQDWNSASAFELWIERAFVLRVNCDACEKWMIPTTHPSIDLPEDTLALLTKNYRRHVHPREVTDILELIPRLSIRLYGGAALGPARVIRLTGQLNNAFAWSNTTPLLNENDFLKLQSNLRGKLVGQMIENLESDVRLLELIRLPIDLDRIYPEKLCRECGHPNTEKICGKEIERIVNSAAKGEGIFEVPGGNLLVNETFKAAVERLELNNAFFKKFVLDKYLKEFRSVV